MRKLFLFLVVALGCGVSRAEIIRIDPNQLSTPLYSIDMATVRLMSNSELKPDRYITFLGTWENNGNSNWERSAWWGRFYVDCIDETYWVKHIKYRMHRSTWRDVRRNATALYAVDIVCTDRASLPVESRSIEQLDDEFTDEFHKSTRPFKTNWQ